MADADLVQQAYTSTLKHFIQTGRAPHFTELAATMGVSPDEAKDFQRQAAEAAIGSWISHDTDYVGSFAPFSNTPTHYLVTVDGEQKWYGQ